MAHPLAYKNYCIRNNAKNKARDRLIERYKQEYRELYEQFLLEMGYQPIKVRT